MTDQHKEHLGTWFLWVFDTASDGIGQLPPTPTITDEFDQLLGEIENMLQQARTMVKQGGAIND